MTRVMFAACKVLAGFIYKAIQYSYIYGMMLENLYLTYREMQDFECTPTTFVFVHIDMCLQ